MKIHNPFYQYKNIILLIFFIFNSLFLYSQTPETPSVDYVTVDAITENPIVVWAVNDPSLINGYIIKRYIYSCVGYNPNWHSIATVHSSNQFIFEDNTSECEAKPNERSEKYMIRSFKINGNDTIYSSLSNYQQTIFLDVNYNYCEKANYLKWNNYVGWGSHFLRYDIYSKSTNGNYIKIFSTNYNDTSFTDINVENNTNYSYYIKAVRNDAIESNSNIAVIFTKTIKFPQFLKPDSLIVDDKINLSFTIDADAEVERYVLYKSSSLNGMYDSINFQNMTYSNKLNFDDNYNQKRNYYFLSAQDYCYDEVFKSRIISNIQLSSRKKNEIEKKVILEWDSENGKEYEIFRCDKPSNNYSELNATFNLSFLDDIQDVFNNEFNNNERNGEFCYRIISNEDDFVNKSNIEYLKFEETVFIANAFNPKSNIEENRIFKPKLAFVKDYQLTVYGSFGNIIFETTNPNIGWDGKLLNGKFAQRATYLYYISYINSLGKKNIKKGFVSLVY